jgi:nucleotide-binding universal stress UspA family protein
MSGLTRMALAGQCRTLFLLVTATTYRSRCIVVGYDGTDPSRSAVAYAARRVGKDGKVVVVHVSRSPVPSSETMRGQVFDALLIQSGDVLRDTDFDLEIVAGRPATAIASIAKERNADEIAVGARGARPGQRLPDSVSHELRQIADRPVVVIPFESAGRIVAI